MCYCRLKRYLLSALFLFAGLFIFIAIAIVIGGLTDNIGFADVAVVFGNTVTVDGKPSTRLRARLDKAIDVFRKGFVTYIFVSGGVGIEGYDEALVMNQYLIQKGIPGDKIITDNQGKNTYLTAKHVTKWLSDNGYHSVMVISQYFHIPRSELALRRLGVKTIYSAHANIFEIRDIYSTAREVFAFSVYFVRQYR